MATTTWNGGKGTLVKLKLTNLDLSSGTMQIIVGDKKNSSVNLVCGDKTFRIETVKGGSADYQHDGSDSEFYRVEGTLMDKIKGFESSPNGGSTETKGVGWCKIKYTYTAEKQETYNVIL